MDYNFIFSFHYSVSYELGHLLVCKSKNLGSWVYQLIIQFIVVSSFFLQDYISFIFSLVFFFFVFFFGLAVYHLSFFLSTPIKGLRIYCFLSFSSFPFLFFLGYWKWKWKGKVILLLPM